jgi:hypothetical protein
MILVVDAVTKDPKQFGDKAIWGIKTKDGNWYDFHGGFRPDRGQSLNAKIWEVKGKNGKAYLHADLMEPPPQAVDTRLPPLLAPQPEKNLINGAQNLRPNDKIKWEDWVQISEAAHDLAVRMEPEPATSPNDHAPAARLAFVNTTLIAFSNGKLELPTDAGPVSREPGDDDPYADPDKVLPPEWGR